MPNRFDYRLNLRSHDFSRKLATITDKVVFGEEDKSQERKIFYSYHFN